MKNKSKSIRIIIIINILIIGLIVLNLSLSYYNSKTKYSFYDLQFKIPKGYKYETFDDANFRISNGGDWYGVVGLYRKDEFGVNNIQELYENRVEEYKNSEDITIGREKINNIDMVVYHYKDLNKVMVAFESPYNSFYRVGIEYYKENFDLNSLDSVYTSLLNAKKIKVKADN